MDKLSPLKYKNYIWPVNPATYKINFEKNTAVHHYPYTNINEVDDMGMKPREVSGTGEFVGEGAYDEFKKLATVFYNTGPGTLIHPIWQIQQAIFNKLEVEQEPTPNYVKYSFSFIEHIPDNVVEEFDKGKFIKNDTKGEPIDKYVKKESKIENKTHTIKKGECLSLIAKKYNKPWRDIAKKNNLKNPNLIQAGQKLII